MSGLSSNGEKAVSEGRRALHPNVIRIGLLVAVLSAVCIHIYRQQVRPVTGLPAGVTIIPDYDTGGKALGNPENGVKGLRNVERLLGLYRKRNSGKFPESMMSLCGDIYHHKEAYGLTMNQVDEMLQNPDTKYSDAFHARQNPDHFIPYAISNPRPDGTQIGSSKEPGKRDVYAVSSLYAHENLVHKGDKSSMKPSGFYLVLWEDGQIEKISMSRVYMTTRDGKPVRVQGSSFQVCFEGQAGVPGKPKTYDEFYKTPWVK